MSFVYRIVEMDWAPTTQVLYVFRQLYVETRPAEYYPLLTLGNCCTTQTRIRILPKREASAAKNTTHVYPRINTQVLGGYLAVLALRIVVTGPLAGPTSKANQYCYAVRVRLRDTLFSSKWQDGRKCGSSSVAMAYVEGQ